MNRIRPRVMPEKRTAKEDLLSILKGFDREEAQELLSEAFFRHCERLLLLRDPVSLKKRKRVISDVGSTRSDGIPDRYYLESSNKNGSVKSRRNIQRSVDKFSAESVDGSKRARFANVGRKTHFEYFERVNGKSINVVQGLELHTRVFNDDEQNKIVQSVYEFQRLGQRGRLRDRTYSEPSKWMRGKGRVTIQFGCCYNYAVDKNGNPPGIIRNQDVDPLPPIFINMIKRLVRWHVLPPTCVPNSCIVNIYEEGDCIPPHIDHHDFLRPFCTISFLTQCNILFGSNLKIIGPGEFAGPFSMPLPVGSVLVLKGNGADVAKHCVPAVPAKRISITFRKMDESKIPYRYSPDPKLRAIQPF